MLIIPSFKKSLKVEQFQGNYLKLIFQWTRSFDFGHETQQGRLWPFFEARGDHKLLLKCQLESTSPAANLKLTYFSNWRTACPIQFLV